jgi:hypothetical protein
LSKADKRDLHLVQKIHGNASAREFEQVIVSAIIAAHSNSIGAP